MVTCISFEGRFVSWIQVASEARGPLLQGQHKESLLKRGRSVSGGNRKRKKNALFLDNTNMNMLATHVCPLINQKEPNISCFTAVVRLCPVLSMPSITQLELA